MKKGSSSQAVAMSKHRARLLFTVIYEDAHCEYRVPRCIPKERYQHTAVPQPRGSKLAALKQYEYHSSYIALGHQRLLWARVSVSREIWRA